MLRSILVGLIFSLLNSEMNCKGNKTKQTTIFLHIYIAASPWEILFSNYASFRQSYSNKLCAWRHDMPPPLSSPCGRRSASRRRADRRACRRQRSSSLPRSIRSHADRCSCLCVNAMVSKPAWWPWPLTFWPWKWFPSRVWRGLPVCKCWSC